MLAGWLGLAVLPVALVHCRGGLIAPSDDAGPDGTGGSGGVTSSSGAQGSSSGSSGAPSSSSGSGSSGAGSGSGGTGSSGGGPSGCTTASNIDCSGGATGYLCSVSDNPQALDSSLACSVPTPTGSKAAYCCFSWNPTDACQPDDELTSTCPDPDTYPFQCIPGSDPTTLESRLSCSVGVVDPDGVHDDFCCDYD